MDSDTKELARRQGGWAVAWPQAACWEHLTRRLPHRIVDSRSSSKDKSFLGGWAAGADVWPRHDNKPTGACTATQKSPQAACRECSTRQLPRQNRGLAAGERRKELARTFNLRPLAAWRNHELAVREQHKELAGTFNSRPGRHKNRRPGGRGVTLTSRRTCDRKPRLVARLRRQKSGRERFTCGATTNGQPELPNGRLRLGCRVATSHPVGALTRDWDDKSWVWVGVR